MILSTRNQRYLDEFPHLQEKKPAPKKDDGFDDFYDEEPISEANVGEIAKSVDTDKMDSKLFSKKDASPPLFHAPSGDFNSIGKSSTGGLSDKTVIEKPMSAPGIRTPVGTPATPTKTAFDDFEVDSLLPDAAPTKEKSVSAQGGLAPSSEPPVKSSSLPLPDSKPGTAGKSSLDLSSSGEFSGSGYLPSTGPTRGTVAGKSVSFADDRPPTRVGKKLDDGSDWLELAGTGGGGGPASVTSSTGGRTSALDDILNATATSSRRPGTSVTPASSKLDSNKPKSAPGGLDLEGDSHRASQSRGPSAGSAYSQMKFERDEDSKPPSGILPALDEKEEPGAPTPPANLLSATGSAGSGSTLGTPEQRTAQRSRPTVGSAAATSILLDTDDIFSVTGEFNPIRSRRPASGESADQGMPSSGVSNQAVGAVPRQGTPPAVLGDGLGADASAISELTRLVQLHNRESQLSAELTAVRRHMDVNRLYLQRILGSVFGLETPIPDQPVQQLVVQQEQKLVEQKQPQHQPQQQQKVTTVVDDSKVQQLEAELAHMRMQVTLLQNIKDTLQIQHEQELVVVRKSYQRQIDEVEEAARHKEDRLKTALNDVSEELEATKKRCADVMTEKALSQKSEIERLARERDEYVRQMANRHREEMSELRRAHEEQVELLRAERRADAAAAGAAPELKVLADHLAELESNVSQRHESSMSLKMVMFTDREAQLRTQEAALAKERDQIRQALLQLEQAKNELQQQRWVTEQKEAKLTAMQTALEEERKRLAESSDRDRAHLDKMRCDMIEEHGKLLADIFRERQRLSQEAEKIEAEHRRLISSKSELQHQQAMTSQTLAQARQAEEKIQAETSKMLADREKMLSELHVLDEQRASFFKVKQEIDDQRRSVEAKLRDAEMLATKGSEAMAAAEVIRAEGLELKQQVSEKQAAISEAQSAFIDEQNRLSKDRAELEQLRRSFVCSQCQRGVSMAEVRKVTFESSPKFTDIRSQMADLEQKMNADLRPETKAERDISEPAVYSKKKTPRRRKGADKGGEFDYEAEKAWLSQLQRFRFQSSSTHV